MDNPVLIKYRFGFQILKGLQNMADYKLHQILSCTVNWLQNSLEYIWINCEPKLG